MQRTSRVSSSSLPTDRPGRNQWYACAWREGTTDVELRVEPSVVHNADQVTLEVRGAHSNAVVVIDRRNGWRHGDEPRMRALAADVARMVRKADVEAARSVRDP